MLPSSIESVDCDVDELPLDGCSLKDPICWPACEGLVAWRSVTRSRSVFDECVLDVELAVESGGGALEEPFSGAEDVFADLGCAFLIVLGSGTCPLLPEGHHFFMSYLVRIKL